MTSELKDLAVASLRSEWSQAKAHFSEDGASLHILGQPVMEQWESPYMALLASIACRKPGGRVLEVGYGLGISAAFVDEHKHVANHTVVEANEEVAKKAQEWAKTAQVSTKVVCGLWQEVCPSFPSGSFDSILFDVFPLSSAEVVDGEAASFFREAARLLTDDGVFTFYFDAGSSWWDCKKLFLRDTVPLLKEAGFASVDCEDVAVSPPVGCTYFWKSRMLAPIAFRTKAQLAATNDTRETPDSKHKT